MSRRTFRTSPEALDRFIEALAAGETVRDACTAAGIGRQTAYDYRQQDEAFALRWADAIEDGTEELEKVARRRAIEGSDHLIMFLLKARRPEVYRERLSVDQTSRVAAPSARELEVVRLAAERDPDAFARAARAMADELAAEEGRKL